MSKILSIGTALPAFRHSQPRILEFMQTVYAQDEREKRKLRYLYEHSGIEARYSVLPDFSLPAGEWSFFPGTENLEPFPGVEKRLKKFEEVAPALGRKAIQNCFENANDRFTNGTTDPVGQSHTLALKLQRRRKASDETRWHPSTPLRAGRVSRRDARISHLITVSCTGISAPGLDLEILSLLELPSNTWRTSVNFMGCYAAIHALKLADLICRADENANVLIVCVECCTLHFQKDYEENSVTSSLLFGDGAAALLVSGDASAPGLHIDHFYSMVDEKGKQDMRWEISAAGFLMQLSSEVPAMINGDFGRLVDEALASGKINREEITDWCIHPGGKRILEAVQQSLSLTPGDLDHCYGVMREYGNMSSPTVLFVLDRIWKEFKESDTRKIFGAAFGPGLTMESFILSR